MVKFEIDVDINIKYTQCTVNNSLSFEFKGTDLNSIAHGDKASQFSYNLTTEEFYYRTINSSFC